MEEGSVWTVVLGSNPRAFCITPAQRRLWWTGKVAPGQTFQKGAAANRSCQCSASPVFSWRAGAGETSRFPAPGGWLLTWPLQVTGLWSTPSERLAKRSPPPLGMKSSRAKQATWQTLTSSKTELRTNKSEEDKKQRLKPQWPFPPTLCCRSSCSLGLIKCCEVSAWERRGGNAFSL